MSYLASLSEASLTREIFFPPPSPCLKQASKQRRKKRSTTTASNAHSLALFLSIPLPSIRLLQLNQRLAKFTVSENMNKPSNQKKIFTAYSYITRASRLLCFPWRREFSSKMDSVTPRIGLVATPCPVPFQPQSSHYIHIRRALAFSNHVLAQSVVQCNDSLMAAAA